MNQMARRQKHFNPYGSQWKQHSIPLFAAPPIFKKIIQLNYLFSLYFTVSNQHFIDQENNLQTMIMDSYDAVPKATNYLNLDIDKLKETVVVLPPYKDDPSRQWIRGYLKLRNESSPTGNEDFIFTGPKLRITYNGCSWNKIVFNMDDSVADFRAFLSQVSSIVRSNIYASPGKFKLGALNESRFSWEDSMLIKQSEIPDRYSDELKCRLSTFRDMTSSTDEESTSIEIPDTYFFKELCDGTRFPVLPDEIQAGDYLIPVFRLSYGRNINRFFLILTLLKGKVIPNEKPVYKKIKNEDWEMDESI